MILPSPELRDEVETSLADHLPELVSLRDSWSADEEGGDVVEILEIELDGDVVQPGSEPFRVPLGVDGDLKGGKRREGRESVSFRSIRDASKEK